jgi:hypothetical protein
VRLSLLRDTEVKEWTYVWQQSHSIKVSFFPLTTVKAHHTSAFVLYRSRKRPKILVCFLDHENAYTDEETLIVICAV